MGEKKILIIDYDQSSLATLQGILTREGYEVVTAADGQAGWDNYNREKPDLVLLEAMLPKVHGFELCQRITSERNSTAPVFIMTGVYKDRVYRTEALRTYGASEYFEKPLKMAELLASIEAVLGKPEPKPVPRPEPVEPQPAAESVLAKPVREIKPAAVPVEPKKREKHKSDDDIFSLPADLDQMSRDLPKAHKPAPVHHGPPAEARFESLADDLLQQVIIESSTPKPVEAKPTGGNGNGNGKSDIDQFLKSALAGLDLNKEKVKVPKTAPLPPPPVEEKPKPTPPDGSTHTAPAVPASRNTLAPGDPGSDISPFFTSEKSKPEAPVQKTKPQAPVPTPSARPAPPVPFKPLEKAEKRAAPAPAPAPKPAPVRRESIFPEPVRREPVRVEPRSREAEAIASTAIFESIAESKFSKGFPKVIAVGLGVVAVAVVAFFLLRPKHTPPSNENVNTPQTVTQTNVPSQTVEEAPPPEVKPAPVKQKAQPQAKPAEPDPALAEAILPAASPAVSLPLTGAQSDPGTGSAQTAGGQNAGGTNAAQADPPPVKVGETAPPVKTEADPGTAAAAPASSVPAAPTVNEGDLVELSSVTEPPKIIKSVDPAYPPAAQRLGIGGSITVNALIDEKGNVIDTGILKGIQGDRGLGRAAETAVKKWKFQPARKNGVAVKVWKSFVIAFKAATNPANTLE